MPVDPLPDAREYPSRPWVGVGVIVWRDDRVLLVRRGRPPRLGEWSLPGGAQQVGETVAEAAEREVLEETGLIVVSTDLVSVEDAITRDDAGATLYHYTLVEIAAEWRSGDPVAADDALDAGWFTLAAAENRLAGHAAARRVLRLAAERRGVIPVPE